MRFLATIAAIGIAFVIYSANKNGVNRAQEQRQEILRAQNNLDLDRGPVAIRNFHFDPQAEYTAFVDGFLSTADMDTLSRALPAPLDVEASIRGACHSNRDAIIELCRDMHNLTVREARAQGSDHVTKQDLQSAINSCIEGGHTRVMYESILTDMGI